MKVSVIIPNHGRDLTKALESIKNSTYKEIYVCVVDRGLERAIQRNMGILENPSDAYLFLDSDQSISPGLIEECVDFIKVGFSCVYIPEIIVAKSFFGRVRAFERSFYTGTAVDVPRFVRKDCCPMFDEEQKGTEDSDFGNRIIGLRAISQNVLYHHDDISVFEYFRKKNFYAKSLKRYISRNPNDKILDLKYRCFWIFVENGKWKRLLRHPILTLGIIFILIIRGIIYVKSKYLHTSA